MAIWITSDLHFSHEKDFIYGPRGFKSAQEMNETIISVWNRLVRPDDDVYVLGDMFVGGTKTPIEVAQNLIGSLRGRIHIVRGNHDTETKLAAYKKCRNVVEIENAIFLDYRKYHFYLSHFPTITYTWSSKKKELSRMSINLCGHVHTKDPFFDFDKGPIFHCEWDTLGRPWMLDEAIDSIVAGAHKYGRV